MKTYMEKQHWIRMELINDMKGKKAKRKKKKEQFQSPTRKKKKRMWREPRAEKAKLFARRPSTQHPIISIDWNVELQSSIQTWERVMISINQSTDQSINHMLSSHSYSCPFAHVPGLPGAKAKHMMMDKPENLGWTSVDRSTKATLSTYNTQIHLSRLQKIYHFQSSKLRLATQSL